jgi:hypothetical protein
MRPIFTVLWASAALGALALLPIPASANDNSTPPPPPQPPQEAVDACASLSEGVPCSVTYHSHSMQGTCRNSPSGDGPLACAPQPPQR